MGKCRKNVLISELKCSGVRAAGPEEAVQTLADHERGVRESGADRRTQAA